MGNSGGAVTFFRTIFYWEILVWNKDLHYIVTDLEFSVFRLYYYNLLFITWLSFYGKAVMGTILGKVFYNSKIFKYRLFQFKFNRSLIKYFKIHNVKWEYECLFFSWHTLHEAVEHLSKVRNVYLLLIMLYLAKVLSVYIINFSLNYWKLIVYYI